MQKGRNMVNFKNYPIDVINRFWNKSKIPKDYEIGCWVWIACKDKDGYGFFRLNGKNIRAHRFVYEYYKGIIPSNTLVLHSCDNTSCISPYHLFLGTNQDNMLDKVQKQRCNSKHGEECHYSKLSENDVICILEGIQNGKFTNIHSITNTYNISHNPIHDILNGKSWKNITKQYSQKQLKQFKLKIRGYYAKKLEEQTVILIKIDLKNNIKRSILSNKYNVSRSTIDHIAQGRTWKHIII